MRREINTIAHAPLPARAGPLKNQAMAERKVNLSPFGVLLHTAAKIYPDLWREDGRLNLAAVATLYRRRGNPVPQATLWRNSYQKPDGSVQHPADSTINATHKVFDIPKELLRGEAVSRRLEDLLSRYPLEVLLLMQRIGKLSDEDRGDILRQLERMEDRAEQLHKAMQHGNVTQITRRRD